jgi:hypothetical protein
MTPPKPIAVKIPLFTEGTIMLQILVLHNETAGQLCRRMGICHPSSLCRWPLRVRLLPHENVYQLLRRGESLYIHSKDFTDLTAGITTPARGVARKP